MADLQLLRSDPAGSATSPVLLLRLLPRLSRQQRAAWSAGILATLLAMAAEWVDLLRHGQPGS